MSHTGVDFPVQCKGSDSAMQGKAIFNPEFFFQQNSGDKLGFNLFSTTVLLRRSPI